jgi:predicted NBD/HSP70 family sugar kinase
MKNLVIDLRVVRNNLRAIKDRAEGVSVFADLSASAGGMGLLPVAEFLRDEGIRSFIVSDTSDARLLRENNFRKEQIMMLHSTADPNEISELLSYGVICTAGSYDAAVAINGIAESRKIVADIQVKIDTGLGVYGFQPTELDKVAAIYKYMSSLNVVGTFTTFSASWRSKKLTFAQLDKFNTVLDRIIEMGFEPGAAHACDSAALFKYDIDLMDAVCVDTALTGRIPGKPVQGLSRVGFIEAGLEEVVWHPKLKTAAAKLPRVDSVGVSSAGIYINNRTCVASLFIKVPEEKYHKARDIYIRAAAEIGTDIPVTVTNDGDVTAIAGGMSLNSNRVLGIAMGTSEAAGYLNSDGGLNGWLSELAFAPCDLNPNAALCTWSGDVGTGVNYFSQDAVIKLCPAAGIKLDGNLSPAEKLSVVQDLMGKGDKRAAEVYRTIGIYLGYTLPFYALFYDIKYALVLGRVLSGKGGDLIVEIAKEVLREEFPSLKIEIVTPDEKFKRVGQSIAASSL